MTLQNKSTNQFIAVIENKVMEKLISKANAIP